MSADSSPPKTRFYSPRWLFVLGILLSAGLTGWLYQYNQTLIERHATQAADALIASTLKQLQLYDHGLRATRGAIATLGPESLNREAFLRYVKSRDFAQEYPGAFGFGFIRRVPQKQTASFLDKARADGWTSFTIKELQAHEHEHFVIQYIEPSEPNLQAIGLDIASVKTAAKRHWPPCAKTQSS